MAGNTPSIEIGRAAAREFLSIAALDRLAWPIVPDEYIPDGEHIWRVWCDFATLLAARQSDTAPPLAETGHIAGAVVMFPTQTGELFLHKIMVHPALRGLGIGSRLMQAALAEADRPVLLTVNPANVSAIKLYENFGYRIREHVPGYYRPHEHRHIMIYEPR